MLYFPPLGCAYLETYIYLFPAGLSRDILRRVLSQVDVEESVFDSEEISEESMLSVLREMITYASSDADKYNRSNWAGQSFPHQEDTEAVSERDFLHFMSYR
jgi:hypothetical protein